MASQYEVRLSGYGGQGLILAGKIMAEAAAIYDGKNATQSQSYGPEARGGASKAEVIISEEEIYYPKASRLDLLLSLSQKAADTYIKDLKEEGIFIYDSDLVNSIPEGKFRSYGLPITQIAVEKAGKAMVANIVALGVIVQISAATTVDAMRQAILSKVPKGTENLNLSAYTAGLEAARELLEKAVAEAGNREG